MKPVIWSWYKLYCLVSEESVWNSSWAAPSWFLGLELDSSLLIFPHEFPPGFPDSTGGLGLVGCSGLVGVPGLPSVSLPDFPGSPPDFFMKFLIFLLFLYLLSHGSFPGCPGSPPVFFHKYLIRLLLLFLIALDLLPISSWNFLFSSSFFSFCPGSYPGFPGSPPVFFQRYLILLLFLFLIPWLSSWFSWHPSWISWFDWRRGWGASPRWWCWRGQSHTPCISGSGCSGTEPFPASLVQFL